MVLTTAASSSLPRTRSAIVSSFFFPNRFEGSRGEEWVQWESS